MGHKLCSMFLNIQGVLSAFRLAQAISASKCNTWRNLLNITYNLRNSFLPKHNSPFAYNLNGDKKKKKNSQTLLAKLFRPTPPTCTSRTWIVRKCLSYWRKSFPIKGTECAYRAHCIYRSFQAMYFLATVWLPFPVPGFLYDLASSFRSGVAVVFHTHLDDDVSGKILIRCGNIFFPFLFF